MLKTKCIDKLLYSKPLTESFHESTEMREQEVENIVTMLSKITDYLVERGIVETLESAEIVDEVRRRFFKQASLVHVSSLMRRLFERECFIDDEDTILSNVLTEDWLRKIDNGIKNIARHPVWTAALDRDEAMKKVKLALEKNQNVQDAFHAVGLNLAYAILGEKDEGFRKLWR